MTHLLAQTPHCLLASATTFWLPDADTLGHLGPMWILCGTIIAILIGSMIVGRGGKAIAGIALAGAILSAASCYWIFPRVMEGGWIGLAPVGKPPTLLADNFSL